jgi:SAM-dependent methyltransferase
LNPARLRARAQYVMTTGARRRLRDLLLRADAVDRFVVREDLARRYLRGDGIELGAATWPLRVPPSARVRYVDRLARPALVESYRDILAASELDAGLIPATDVIDDAATLATFADGSLDFVIACHVLEHIEDPVGCLTNLLRVLRPGGVLFLALPDPRGSFDAARERTSVEHVLRDHRDGPEVSRRGHYEEWARFVEGAADVAARADAFAAEDARHHFHVWELDDFLELLRALELPAELELGQRSGEEFVVILRRSS